LTLRIRTCVSAFLACLLAAGCTTAPGWRPLFDAKSLDGWVVKCKPPDIGKTFWKVDQGTILADSMSSSGHDYVWLCTDKEYSDFVLRLKFQAYRDSPGNSGVQIRSRYDDTAGWLDGPQVDINPPGPWRTGMIWDETRGVQRWLYPDIPAGKWVDESMAPRSLRFVYSDEDAGWNDLEITAAGMHLKAVLNGVTVMNYDATGVLDDVVHTQRQVGRKGIIALQIHKGDKLLIRFKDISIRDMSPRTN
jgi:hypothetical protein